ncbi:hypothetical protein ACFX2C_042637 [Malus domestica]
MKVESKSISYHAFFPSFALVLLSPLPDCLPSLALEYSSSTVDVLLEKMPHLHGEQVRQVKMIPRSMWRQRANSSSTKAEDRLPCFFQKQKYLISSESKAKMSYGMFFLYPCSYLQDNGEGKQSVGTWKD